MNEHLCKKKKKQTQQLRLGFKLNTPVPLSAPIITTLRTHSKFLCYACARVSLVSLCSIKGFLLYIKSLIFIKDISGNFCTNKCISSSSFIISKTFRKRKNWNSSKEQCRVFTEKLYLSCKNVKHELTF